MGEKRGHYCVDGEMWDIDEDGCPALVYEPSAVNVCKAFLELFRDSDMRPEDECHVLYDAAERSIAVAESDNADLRSQLTTAEADRDGYKARCEEMRPALERMVAIGYTHESGCHPSEGRHTEGCREKKAALAQARTALAATEEKMKIIEQSHEILHMDGLDLIERAGRTCYKSEEKIGCLTEGCDYPYGAQACRNCGSSSAHRFVKMLIKRGHEAMTEHGGATVKFITNRGVTHELVRHRVASFGQESTRYVNYGGDDMRSILPVWCVEGDGADKGLAIWINAMNAAEAFYNALIEVGWRPEQAREVLPNSLKTEIVVTANYREWRHIFKLRALGTTGKPHPQMQALLLPVLEEFKAKLPALFGDLTA